MPYLVNNYYITFRYLFQKVLMNVCNVQAAQRYLRSEHYFFDKTTVYLYKKRYASIILIVIGYSFYQSNTKSLFLKLTAGRDIQCFSVLVERIFYLSFLYVCIS